MKSQALNAGSFTWNHHGHETLHARGGCLHHRLVLLDAFPVQQVAFLEIRRTVHDDVRLSDEPPHVFGGDELRHHDDLHMRIELADSLGGRHRRVDPANLVSRSQGPAIHMERLDMAPVSQNQPADAGHGQAGRCRAAHAPDARNQRR